MVMLGQQEWCSSRVKKPPDTFSFLREDGGAGNSFIEIQFTDRTVSPFIVYNAVVFCEFTESAH